MLIKYGKNSGMYVLGECSQTFRGMSLNIQGMALYIPGNILKQSAECRQTFRGMFQKTRQNLNFDLCHEILLVFYQLLLLNSNKSRENESRLQITDQIFLRKKKNFYTTTYNQSSELNYCLFKYFLFSYFSFFSCWSKLVITARTGMSIKNL